jgi:hypothetical protein
VKDSGGGNYSLKKKKTTVAPIHPSPLASLIFISLHIRNSCVPSAASFPMANLLNLIILKPFF